MNMPSAANLNLVVGYDGSVPAARALDAAVSLLHGREGRIHVVYVAHLSTAEMMSADAIAEMETSFDELARELETQAAEQLRGQEGRWQFDRGHGQIPDVLIATAQKLLETHPADSVVVVVGSSSQALHRVVGSVAVALARHAPVPIVIVP
jgi:nucleotide-binding universal stress UspA family protein